MSCPLCKFSQIISAPAINNTFGEALNIYQCRNCFSCFVHPLPGKSFIDAYYENTWTDQNRGMNKSMEILFNIFSRIHNKVKNASRWSWIKPWMGPGIRILELGAGNGSFAQFLMRKGFCVSVVEPSQSLCCELTRKGIPVLGHCLDEIDIHTTFDVCLSFHVLEHLRDPAETVLKILPLLKPGGIFLGEVPNAPVEPETLQERLRESVFNNAHLFHYSCKGMTSFLLNQGFGHVECSEIVLSKQGVRKLWNSANMHLLHPSLGAPATLRIQAALHAAECVVRAVAGKSALVCRQGEPVGFREPNDFIAFSAVKVG